MIVPFAGNGRTRPCRAPPLTRRFARRTRQGSSSIFDDPASAATPASRRHACATGGVRADRVGAKLPPRAIATGGAGSKKGASCPSAGPWPVTSRLAEPRARPPAIRPRLPPRGRGSKNSFARGRPRARCAGFGRSVGCARGSKLVAEVGRRRRPVAFPGAKSLRETSGLTAPRESSGRRRGVGSRVRGGEAEDTGGGLPHESGLAKADPREQPVDGRRSGQRSRTSLTRGAGERSSALRGEHAVDRPGATRGA
jgi:hypothetical protein